MQAAAYFKSLITEFERKKYDGQPQLSKPLPPLKVNDIDTRPQGHVSPVSPSQRTRTFGKMGLPSGSPSKGQGLRLVLDSEGDDDGGEDIQLTARRVPPGTGFRDDSDSDDDDDSEDDSDDSHRR